MDQPVTDSSEWDHSPTGPMRALSAVSTDPPPAPRPPIMLLLPPPSENPTPEEPDPMLIALRELPVLIRVGAERVLREELIAEDVDETVGPLAIVTFACC